MAELRLKPRPGIAKDLVHSIIPCSHNLSEFAFLPIAPTLHLLTACLSSSLHHQMSSDTIVTHLSSHLINPKSLCSLGITLLKLTKGLPAGWGCLIAGGTLSAETAKHSGLLCLGLCLSLMITKAPLQQL